MFLCSISVTVSCGFYCCCFFTLFFPSLSFPRPCLSAEALSNLFSLYSILLFYSPVPSPFLPAPYPPHPPPFFFFLVSSSYHSRAPSCPLLLGDAVCRCCNLSGLTLSIAPNNIERVPVHPTGHEGIASVRGLIWHHDSAASW